MNEHVFTEISNEEASVLLRAFLNLAKHWRLDDRQKWVLLGTPPANTYAYWRAGQINPSHIPEDTRRRLPILMGIHKNLRHIFPRPTQGYGWLHKPNQAFGGGSALDRLMLGSILDLTAVRDYLDAEQAGG